MSQSQDKHRAEGTGWETLTPECGRVQGELLDLAAALYGAALPEYPELVPSFLVALREFHQHLREHVSSVEAPAGLYDYLASSAPSLSSDLNSLSREHCELDGYLGELERQLEGFDPPDTVAAASIRENARGLAALTCCHQQRGCILARRAGGDENSQRG